MNLSTSSPASSTHENQEKPTRAAWYALAMFTLMYVANNIDRSVMSILAEPIRKDFALNDSQLGILSGLAFAVTYSLAGLPIGYLIDRWNRRNLLAGLMTVWSACTALCGFAQSFWGLLWARLAVGASEAGGAPAAMSMIGDLFPRHRRSLAISIFWSSTALGTATSFVFGSIIAAQYGWRAAFLIAGAPGIVIAVLVLLTTREPKRGAMDAAVEMNDAPPSLGETWRFVAGQPHLVHGFVAVGLSAVMLSGVVVWSVSFFVRTHHMELAYAGMIVGLTVAGFGATGSVLGGVWGDYVYKKWGLARLPLLPALTTLIAATCIAITALSPGVRVAFAAFIVFELLSRSYTAAGYNFLLSNMHSRMRGVVVSALQGVTNLVGYGLGPLLVGAASDFTGSLRYGLLTMALVGTWVSFHYYWAYRLATRRERSVNTAVVMPPS